jgi:hypothetical protein
MPQDDEAPIPLSGGEEPEDLTLPVEGPQTAAPQPGSSKIRAFGAVAGAAEAHRKQFRRKCNLTGAGAVRCRLFHSKISVAAMEHMVDTINEWLDGEQVEVKYVTHVVGILEGKTPEPNIIITVWY